MNVHDEWPAKGLIFASKLILKYDILSKIGVSNWVPSNHGWCITQSLSSLVYQIGIRVAFDFGEYVFEKILKQVKSFSIKFSISFPSLIASILVKQKLYILIVEDIIGVPYSPLGFSYKFFVG